MIWSRFLRSLVPVQPARTDEEIEAIQRFRYDICVQEQRDQSHYEADHHKRTIASPQDTAPGTLVLYAGRIDKLIGTIRVRAWEPGELPAHKAQTYSLDLLPDSAALRICETNYLMVRRSKRGSAAALALTCAAIEVTSAEHQWDLQFSTCVPGLVRAYSNLGLRPYGGRPIPTAVGFLVPLMLICNDLDYLRRIRSPWLQTFSHLQRQGKLSEKDLTPFIGTADGYHGIETDPNSIHEEVEAKFNQDDESNFVSLLTGDVLKRLSKAGFVVDLDPGVEVVQEGGADQDLFLILDGVVEVKRNGQYLATRTKGELFGEIALFRASARRTATVVVTVPSRLLVVRKSTLDRLEQDSPRDALAVYKALSRIMAERVSA